MDKYKELIELLRKTADVKRLLAHEGTYELLMQAADAIEELFQRVESVGNAPTGWIPVSEKLPEKTGWYIVTADGEPTFRWYSRAHGFEWYSEIPITAWMPLPEPYKWGRKEDT